MKPFVLSIHWMRKNMGASITRHSNIPTLNENKRGGVPMSGWGRKRLALYCWRYTFLDSNYNHCPIVHQSTLCASLKNTHVFMIYSVLLHHLLTVQVAVIAGNWTIILKPKVADDVSHCLLYWRLESHIENSYEDKSYTIHTPDEFLASSTSAHDGWKSVQPTTLWLHIPIKSKDVRENSLDKSMSLRAG